MLTGVDARRRRIPWRPLAVLAAILLLWFGFLELRGLYFPDEGRYAEIPREMLATGDWVTPHLNGFAYFEKPPLQYWITAATFAVAGEDEWTTRLWPALAGFLGVLAVLLTARRLFSPRAGWMAAAVMGSCWGYFLATQFVTLDMGLTAFMTGALCAFLIAQDARSDTATRRRYMLAAWALCALAVLTKGLIGVALPVLSIVAYVALARDLSLLRRLHLVSGLALFAVIAVPWFVIAEVRNPGFAEFFFIHEHLQRYTQPLHRRTGPWWYFVPIAAVFLMPWLPAIVASLSRTPRSYTEGVDARRFAWCSAAAIFVFFSLSSSKLPAYIMPAMGAVALAVSVPLARRLERTLRVTAWTLIVSGIAAALAAHPAAESIKVPIVREGIAASLSWIMGSAAVLIVAGVASLWLRHRGQRLRALALIAIASMTACQVGAVLAARVDGYFSAESLIERLDRGEVKRPFKPDVPFYSVDMFDHTVPFYLGRTVTLVREEGELAWGIAAAPQNFIGDIAEFQRRWRNDREAYAIMGRETFDWLQSIGLPMQFVDTDGRRVIVRR